MGCEQPRALWEEFKVANIAKDEEDGDWIAPLVPNPKCEDASGCGEWTQPKIRNPTYKVSFAPITEVVLRVACTLPVTPYRRMGAQDCSADTPQGKWTAPRIPNPEYKGSWSPAQIPNAAYFEDKTPSDFTKIAGIGIELWTMTEDILCEWNIFQNYATSI